MPLNILEDKMNIEDLKKRKTLIENDLKMVNDRITQDTQNAFRLQGAIFNLNDLIKIEEEKNKEKDKVEKKKVK